MGGKRKSISSNTTPIISIKDHSQHSHYTIYSINDDILLQLYSREEDAHKLHKNLFFDYCFQHT